MRSKWWWLIPVAVDLLYLLTGSNKHQSNSSTPLLPNIPANKQKIHRENNISHPSMATRNFARDSLFPLTTIEFLVKISYSIQVRILMMLNTFFA